MFSISLYYCHTENNRMYKDNYMDLIATLMGSFRESVSILSPVITIELTEQIIQNLLEEELIVVDENDVNVVRGSHPYSDIIIKYRKRVLSANYVYIPEFNRYYFVDDIIAITDKLWQLHCSVDVLMSFKEQLGELDVFCDRNEYNYNLYKPDNKIPSELRSATVVSPYVTPSSGNVDIGTPSNPVIRPKAGDYIHDAITETLDNKLHAVVTTCDGSGGAYQDKMITTLGQCRMYGLSMGMLSLLSDEFFTTNFSDGFKQMFSNPADGIYNILILPFDLRKNLTTIVSTDITPILFGSYDSRHYGYLILDKVLGFWGGQIEVQLDREIEFLKYSPYNSAQLFVPYVGYVEIDLNVCMDCLLKLYYWVDITTGDTTIEILCFPKNSQGDYTNTNFLLKILSARIGIIVPVSSSNLMASFIKNSISSITSIASMLMRSSSKVEVGNETTTKYNYSPKTGKLTSERTKVSKQFEETNNLKDFINDASSITVSDMLKINANCNCGSLSSNNGDLGLLQELHIIYQGVRIASNFDIDKYSHLVGRPSSFVGKLKNLYGYTELSGFHLEGLYNCTREEQNEINSILRSGFLMPPQT